MNGQSADDFRGGGITPCDTIGNVPLRVRPDPWDVPHQRRVLVPAVGVGENSTCRSSRAHRNTRPPLVAGVDGGEAVHVRLRVRGASLYVM